MMQWGWDSSKLVRAKVLLVCNFQSDHIRSKRRMLSLISLHALMSGHIEWFPFLQLYNMPEFQLLNFSTRISAWPPVLEGWGQHLGEMFVRGVPFLGVFSFFFLQLTTMCGYKCLMNETFSVAKVCRECLKMSLLFILLSIFKLCLKEGRKLKSACCSIVFYREKFRMDRKGLFFPYCGPPIFCIFAIVFVMLCCLNIPSQNLSHLNH